jgi:acyl-CoA thioesterase FadM
MPEELLYENSFNFQVYHKNDGNGHLGNPKYFDYCELARCRFLVEFGWSDPFFNIKGVAMRRKKYIEPDFSGDLKQGDKVRVDLRFLLLGEVKFDMHFRFFNDLGELVFETHTKDTFVKPREGKKPRPTPIPDFFLSRLREHRDKA